MNNLVKSRKIVHEQHKQIKPLCIVSDFHGIFEAMDFVRNKIEQDNERVAILGDCMDRGVEGMKVLSEIKSMEESGKDIMYLPGNHDDMLYLRFKSVIESYADFKNTSNLDEYNLEYLRGDIINIIRLSKYGFYAKVNGQLPTLDEILKMCGTLDGTKEFLELMLWLEQQPILRIETDCDGRKIAMGHAAFDMDVYREKKNYCLRDKAETDSVFEELKINAPDSQEFCIAKSNISKAYTSLWYRNPNDNGNFDFNNVVKLPNLSEADMIVVGHSPKQMEVEIIGENITRKAIDVDGGTVECYKSGEGKILKFEPYKEIMPTKEVVESFKNPKVIMPSTVLKISDLYRQDAKEQNQEDVEEQDDVKIWTSSKSKEEESVKIWVPRSEKNKKEKNIDKFI